MTYHRFLTPIISICLIGASEGHAQFSPPESAFRFEDYLIAPLRIHFLSSPSISDWQTTLSDEDAARILDKINGVWDQAGIRFQLESLVREEAAQAEIHEYFKNSGNLSLLLQLRPKATRDDRLFHLYYIKQMPVNGVFLGQAMFVKDQAKLRTVEGGIDEPLPRVSAHEIGHALGLGHRQNETNLMASRTTGIWLNAEEIAKARETAHFRSWIQSAQQMMRRADNLHDQGHRNDAQDLYRCLAALPVESPEVKRAQERISSAGQ